MINSQLKARFDLVVRRHRGLRLWSQLAAGWTGAALFGLGLMGLEHWTGWTSSLALPVTAALGVAAVFTFWWRRPRGEPDWRVLAQQIEARHPELEGRLLTAVQQEPAAGSQFSYLQGRLLAEALEHSQRCDWNGVLPRSRVTVAQWAHGLALVLFALVLWELRITGGHALFAKQDAFHLTVSPGDTSLERGDNLVVMARFAGRLPAQVDLVVGSAVTNQQRTSLVKSLADPVFGGSVPSVHTNLNYHLEFAGQRTRNYHVTVFEYPRLERADVALTYPAYTKQPPRQIKNTRRISAVEGTRMALNLQLNKRVTAAKLVAVGTHRVVVPLTVAADRPVATLSHFALVASHTYALQLVDADGRTNRAPPQFVFNALPDRRPEIKIISPRGDTRPSPLEEISFTGTVWDDFGVRKYGLAYTLAGQPTRFIELGHDVPAQQKQAFHHLLRLEAVHVQPEDLLAWYVWADDTGPNGRVRRTTGDMFFAEVRPFEEVFREGQGMARNAQQQQSQSGGMGSPTARLAELQKQIISATWRLQRQGDASPTSASPAAPEAPEQGAERKPASEVSPSPQSSDELRSKAGDFWARSQENGHSFDGPFSSPARFSQPSLVPVSFTFMGQRAAAPDNEPIQRSRFPRLSANAAQTPGQTNATAEPLDDLGVVRAAQSQAIEQAQSAQTHRSDPRSVMLWNAAILQMKQAVAHLQTVKHSPAALAQALAAEQAAYQALLKLQQHEFTVARRNRRGGGGGGGSAQQRMLQPQLDQLQLTQSANRYETERQAQPPRNAAQREQLQVMNRLQELARRQQDLNRRFQELQTALQAARTQTEREAIQRQLKRLEDEEQQMLSRVDQLRQRMDRPENQSRMSDSRRQLAQTREELERAAEAARQGQPSQALAEGTRAQRQLQQLHDNLRRQSASGLKEDLRQMRTDARELARHQEDLQKQLDSLSDPQRRSLSDSDLQQSVQKQLAQQQRRLTNLIARASALSQQADKAEPLMAHELYDTVRQFSQDDLSTVKRFQEQLLQNRMMTRSLYSRLKQLRAQDDAKSLKLTSELLRQGYLPQARRAEQQARTGIENLKRGVERAAERVLGNDTQGLRLARDELEQLTKQLQQERPQNQVGRTNTSDVTQWTSSRSANRARSPGEAPASRESLAQSRPSRPRTTEPRSGRPTANPRLEGGSRPTGAGGGRGYPLDLDRLLGGNNGGSWGGPITGENFGPWSDRVREVEELVDTPALRSRLEQARARAQELRINYKRTLKKPDWDVVRLQVVRPLVEVHDAVAEELARRSDKDTLVPIDRDPVPSRYSDLVRRYYEELGRDK